MTNNMKLWGEYDPPKDGPKDVISPELSSLLIQKALKPVPLKLYQPCGNQEPSLIELPPECSAMDDTILHTIKLLQYEKKMTNLIDQLKSHTKRNTDFSDEQDQKPLPFPEQLDKKPLHTLEFPFRYMELKSSPFTRGEPISVPELSETNRRLILRKSVATLFAHVGYDTTSQAVLDTMTDISEDFILKFVNLLRVAVDQEFTSGSTGFPDSLERAFVEMGIGSMLSLHTFYQQRVLIYHQRVLARCHKLAAEYALLTEPIVKEEPSIESVKCKVENEEVDDDVDVPEIHFPALGDGYAVDELQPSLEPGFQMLHSLEQEEQKRKKGSCQSVEQFDEADNTKMSSKHGIEPRSHRWNFRMLQSMDLGEETNVSVPPIYNSIKQPASGIITGTKRRKNKEIDSNGI